MLFSGLIAVIVGAYIVQSHHNDFDATIAPRLQSEQAEVVSASSAAVKGTVNSAPTIQSARAISAGRLNSQQTTLRTRVSSRPDTLSATQAMIVPVVVPRETADPPQRKTHGVRQTQNR
jgi:hypothetical protein